MTTMEGTVFVVDDDPAVRDSLRRLLESAGLHVVTYPGAELFLECFDAARPGCLVLDLRMPGMGGGVLQEKLAAMGEHLPVVVLSAHGTIESAVRAMKLGAVDFLRKPCDTKVLLSLVRSALERDVLRHRRKDTQRDLRARLERLSSREREVLDHLLAGQPTKAIAADLGLSRKTIDVHRINILRKVNFGSVVELIASLHDEPGLDDAPPPERAPGDAQTDHSG